MTETSSDPVRVDKAGGNVETVRGDVAEVRFDTGALSTIAIADLAREPM